MFKAFQLSFIKLLSLKNFFILSKINCPEFNSKADSPIITIGFLEFNKILEASFSLFMNFFISSVVFPTIL